MDSRLDLIIRARDEASKAVDKLKKQIDSVENSTESLNSKSGKLGTTITGSFSKGVQALNQYKVAIIAAGAALGTLIVKYGSEVQNMNNRILSLSDSQEQATETFESLIGVAKRSRSGLDGVVSTFQRLEMTNKSLGIETAHTIKMTETISKGLQLSGASAAESSAAMLQLGQAYASGRLQGDEFRALSETFPMLMMQIQQSLGVTTAELKAMGSEGLITRDVINQALNDMATTVEGKFKDMPITISQAFTNMGTTITATLARVNQETGVFDRIAEGIQWVSTKIEEILPKIVTFLTSLSPETITVFAGALAGPLVVGLGAATVAAAQFILAISPFIAIGAAVAYAVYHMTDGFKDFSVVEGIVQNVGDALATFADVAQWVFEQVVEIVQEFASEFADTFDEIAEHLDSLEAVFDVWGAQIEYFWAKHGDTIQNTVGVAWEAIKTWISLSTNIIKNIVLGFLDAIGGFVKSAMALIQGDWQGAWNAIVEAATSIGGRIGNVVMKMLDAVGKFFGKLPEEWKRYGMDAVMGLVNGITEGVGMVTGAAQNLAGAASSAITNALGIHSPSTVMAQYGAWTVEGFANGIRGKQYLATEEVQKITTAIGAQFGNDGEIMKKIREWTKNKELDERITELVETSQAELEKLKESYASSSESIVESMNKLTEEHNKNVDKLVKSLEDLEKQMDSVRGKYQTFLKGEATDFGGQYSGSEEKIKQLEQQIRDAKNEVGGDRTERDIKVNDLQKQLEQEKQALEQLHNFAFGSEQQQKERLQQLEIQHQDLVRGIKNSSDVIDQQVLQERADRIAAQITFIQSREHSLAEDQKRLARGLAKERVDANQSETQNFIDNMVIKANEASNELQDEILRLSQKRDEVELSLTEENKLYEAQRKEIISMWNIIQSHHYSTMQANLSVTREVVGEQIGLYNQLAEAAKKASNAASMGGSSRKVSGYRANGGPVTAGKSYVVGETGREVFTPSANGRINPMGNGGTTLVININAPVGSEEYARIIGQEIVKDLSYSTTY